MKGRTRSPLSFISEVAGRKKAYIVLLMLVQIILGISNVVYALLFREIIDAAVASDKNLMISYIIMLCILVLLQISFRAIVRFLDEYSKASFENAFKLRLFRNILKRDYGVVTKTHSGEWMNRLTSDTMVVSEGLTTIVPGVVGMVVRMLSALVMLIILVPSLGLLLIPAGILLVILTYTFRKRLKRLHSEMQEKDGSLRITLQEYLSSLMIVKAYGKEEKSLKTVSGKLNEHKKARMKKNMFSNLCNIGFSGIMNGAYVVGAIYGAFGIFKGILSYGTFTAIIQLIGQVEGPMANVSGYIPKYFSMLASAERLMEIEGEAREEEIKASEAAVDVKELYARLCSFGLENVDFTYPSLMKDEAMPVVLTDYSLDIKKGEFVAFTGPSGCGKSTVLKLFLDMYKLDKGCVYLQAKDCTISMNEGLRGLFAYVPQGNLLMSGTIRDVVTFASDDEGSAERLAKALDIACADFVRELDNGAETLLGEGGTGLSEGQMQRLAIARAIYSDRPILLLDEATSALDGATEARVLENIRQMTDKTVVIVTHRPAALKICDRKIEFK